MKNNPWQMILLILALTGFPGACTFIPAGVSSTSTPFNPNLTSTKTITPSTTPTPQATLSSVDARQVIESLIANNGNCQLPCIWGLTSGGWTGQAIHPFFAQFGEYTTADVNIISVPIENRLMTILSENDLMMRIDLYLDPSKLDRMHFKTRPYFEVPVIGDIRYEDTYGNPTYNKLFNYYMLPQILTNYGPPTQALLYVYSQDDDPMLIGVFRYVELILYYQQQDFWIIYYMPRETAENYYNGCPVKARIEELTTFLKPHNNVPFLDEIEDTSVSLPIKEATGMTVDEFYQAFKDPENTACIETPMTLWQKP
jgi:hypothetical protein